MENISGIKLKMLWGIWVAKNPALKVYMKSGFKGLIKSTKAVDNKRGIITFKLTNHLFNSTTGKAVTLYWNLLKFLHEFYYLSKNPTCDDNLWEEKDI